MPGSRKSIVVFHCLRRLGWLTIFGPLLWAIRAEGIPPPPAPGDSNAEVLARGPVHEAFAMPVTADQTAGIIVPKRPAGPIEEIPPDMKPESEDAVWIPGYWSWDDDRRDFLWVSGVWRVPPPGYRWMPGYWQEVPGQGYQWISGYWMPAELEETTYLPQPPRSREAGPTGNPPDANHFWVAGYWRWFDARYFWQAGYWSQCQPDWIWTPASYYWCPRGLVCVPGYWDYPLASRGLLFAPVYFTGPLTVYRPVVCLDADTLGISLFCRPSHGHYYFGDYYDDRYAALGFRPWFDCSSPQYGYDPLYSYYRWYYVDHLGKPQWDQRLRGWHDYYRAHAEMRPPQTLTAERALRASPAGQSRPDIRQLRRVYDIHQVSTGPGAFVKLQPVSQAQSAELRRTAEGTVRFGQERRQFESQPIAGDAGMAAPRGPVHAEKADLTQIPSFKSTELPGASASNRDPALSRPTGGIPVAGAAATATTNKSTDRTTLSAGPVISGGSNPGASADPGRGSPSAVASPATASPDYVTPAAAPVTVAPRTVTPAAVPVSAAPVAVAPRAVGPNAASPGRGNPAGAGNYAPGNRGTGGTR